MRARRAPGAGRSIIKQLNGNHICFDDTHKYYYSRSQFRTCILVVMQCVCSCPNTTTTTTTTTSNNNTTTHDTNITTTTTTSTTTAAATTTTTTATTTTTTTYL